MGNIRLRFVSHPGLFNWACQIAQYRFPYTHVEIVLADGKLLGAISDGVKIRDANYDLGKFVSETFLDVAVSDEQARGQPRPGPRSPLKARTHR